MNIHPEYTHTRDRGETIAAEDVMHDIGAISAMSSDSQAMGRVGEVITRTWQTADKVGQNGNLAACAVVGRRVRATLFLRLSAKTDYESSLTTQ